jgi:polysaccharide biosynthesis/export protein VpsN
MTTLDSFQSFLITTATAMLLTCPLAVAQTVSPPEKVGFRNPGVSLAAPRPFSDSTSGGASIYDADDLEEQRETLEGEVRYSKAKLEAARKQQALQAATGDVEKADALDQEIKDWDTRYREGMSKLAEIDAESNTGFSGGHGTDSGLVVPGENLELFVTEDPSFDGRYQVRRGGYIILPQVGRIMVAGKSIDGAEAAVRKALQASQLQRATVMIERIAGLDVASGPRIFLSGEFRAPRAYRIPAGTAPTLVSVIISSGGVTDRADLTRVKVMRMAANKGVVEEVNVKRILEGTGLTSDLTLGEGDVVIVPPGESNLIYVTGNVKRQGSYHLATGEKLTVYGAILQSGGFARFANQRKVHVLRTMPDGTKAKLPVDVVAIQKGDRPDVLLERHDIIVVPEKFFSF